MQTNPNGRAREEGLANCFEDLFHTTEAAISQE